MQQQDEGGLEHSTSALKVAVHTDPNHTAAGTWNGITCMVMLPLSWTQRQVFYSGILRIPNLRVCTLIKFPLYLLCVLCLSMLLEPPCKMAGRCQQAVPCF